MQRLLDHKTKNWSVSAGNKIPRNKIPEYDRPRFESAAHGVGLAGKTKFQETVENLFTPNRGRISREHVNVEGLKLSNDAWWRKAVWK